MNRWLILVSGLVFLSILGAINYYIGKRIHRWLQILFPQINGRMYVGFFLFLTLTLVFTFVRLDFAIFRFLRHLGSYYMGVFAYLAMLFAVSDVVIFTAKLLRWIPSPTPDSVLFLSGFAVLLMTAGLFVYGVYHGNQIQVKNYEVSVDKKDSGLANLNVVMISDLHLGHIYGEPFLKGVVNGVNQLKPDIVCIAGDVFNNDFHALQNPQKAIDSMKAIQSTYGVYACLGNHDTGSSFERMLDFLEQCNIQVLKDEYMVIDNQFVIAGRNDSSPIGYQGELERGEWPKVKEVSIGTGNREVETASALNHLPIIVMDHQPSNLDEYGSETDLLLCGHTHQGQMFPFSLITNAIFTVDHGHYQKDGNSPHVIVTSGVGTWGPPLRVGTDSEIVRIQVELE